MSFKLLGCDFRMPQVVPLRFEIFDLPETSHVCFLMVAYDSVANLDFDYVHPSLAPLFESEIQH